MDISNESESDNEIEISKTNKGKSLAILQGYGYRIEKKDQQKYYWKCQAYHSHLCQARLITEVKNENIECDKHELIKKKGEHNHPPSPTKKSRLDCREEMKKRARRKSIDHNNRDTVQFNTRRAINCCKHLGSSSNGRSSTSFNTKRHRKGTFITRRISPTRKSLQNCHRR